MNVEQARQHALEMAALYEMLREDIENTAHDIDAHNLCSAVIELHDGQIIRLFSYSNPTALPQHIVQQYEFIIGDVENKLINRSRPGDLRDFHTEVRLINFMYASGHLTNVRAITFFSSRSVCASCREAIETAMKAVQGGVPFMALAFKAEVHGGITENVYPILDDPASQEAAINYEQ